MFSMLYPDPMGSLFADAAVSLLRKLTFKGKWALAFCNVDSPKHTLITTNSFPFFIPEADYLQPDKPSEP